MDQLASQLVPIILFTTAVSGIAWSQGLCTKKTIKALQKGSTSNTTDIDELLATNKKKKEKVEPQQQAKANDAAKQKAEVKQALQSLSSSKSQDPSPTQKKGKKGKKKQVTVETESDDEIIDEDEEDRLFQAFLSPEELKKAKKLKEQQQNVQPKVVTQAAKAKAKREREEAEKKRKAQLAAEREQKKIADAHFGGEWVSHKGKKTGVSDDSFAPSEEPRKTKKPEAPKKVVVTIPIQFEKRFAVIGKGGETLKAIVAKTNTWINVPSEETRKTDFVKQYNNAPEYIKIEGFPADCKAAKSIIEDLINKGYSRALDSDIKETTVNVPVNQRGILVGEKGGNLHKIQEAFQVKVVMPDRSSNSEVVTIVGSRSNVEKAKGTIKSLLRNGFSLLTHPDYIKRVMKFDAAYRKNLIGVGGSVIRQLQARTGCRVKFPDDMDTHQVIITGPRDKVAEAAKSIQKLQEDLDASEEEFVDHDLDEDDDFAGDDDDASYYTRPSPWAQ